MIIDFRSDTLTLPTQEMKQAMIEAPLGDDVFGEDPTVIALQDKVAKLLDKEAALFVPTGTMGNLICVLTHCWERGSEVIVGDMSHIHIWEQGGTAQLGGVHPRILANLPDGTFSLEELPKVKRGDNVHWPITTLVCVENTQNMAGGKILPLAWLDELEEVCKKLDLPIHMDGARIMNAAVAMNESPARIVRGCASVSLCLSKGLGAPVGSVIAGSKEFIRKATRMRKVLGGGMRQAGVLAAAGIYALDKVNETISRDHKNAQLIAKAVAEMESRLISVDLKGVHTNVILLECDTSKISPQEFCNRMAKVTEKEKSELQENIVVKILQMTNTAVRFVTYSGISEQDAKLVAKKLHFVIKELEINLL